MTEDKKAAVWAALKQVAEVFKGWVRSFWRNLQQVGARFLEAMRKNVRPKKSSRKEKKARQRMLEEIKKQPAQVLSHHPNCRHSVTPYNPHVREHEGPIGWLDQQEQGYALVSHIPGDKPLPGGPGGIQEPEKYPTIKGQSASADQVREAMIDMANAAADGFKQGVENAKGTGDVFTIGKAARQMGKTEMQSDLRLADQRVHFVNGDVVTLATLARYTHLSVSTIAAMDNLERAFLYASIRERVIEDGAYVTHSPSQPLDRIYIKIGLNNPAPPLTAAEAEAQIKGSVEKLVGRKIADVPTTEVAQMVSASLHRIHDAGYDPQAAEEAKARALEVSRELLEERRQELQTALQYTKHTVKRKSLERQIASINQQLADIPAVEGK